MKTEVRNENGYCRVIATCNIKKGEIVSHIAGTTIITPSKYTIQLNEDQHLESLSNDPNDPQYAWRFINHSCEPNCSIDVLEKNVIAWQDIKSGSEITFDYNTTETELAAPFVCKCGSTNCIGTIRGSSYLKMSRQLQ